MEHSVAGHSSLNKFHAENAKNLNHENTKEHEKNYDYEIS